MRLLHTEKLEFEEFYDDNIPPYIILSHRWGPVKEEVSYNDFISGRKQNTPGYDKLMRFCELARFKNIEYCWMDTCCIDKSSSAELTEAINSMFRWYAESKLCVAYLNDVEHCTEQSISSSLWFTRGWTLQELIAPSNVEFFNSRWERLGSKYDLQLLVSSITGIEPLLLHYREALRICSAACIMSWAAHRNTSRIEDQAYCLMGLFGVNMPLLYGEDNAAFVRLQEQILAKRQDQSLFAWGRPTESAVLTPLFAETPKDFDGCQDMSSDWDTSERTDVRFEMRGGALTICISRYRHPEAIRQLLALSADEDMTVELALDLGCHGVNRATNRRELKTIYLELRWLHGWVRKGIGYRAPPENAKAALLQARSVASADYITLITRSDKPDARLADLHEAFRPLKLFIALEPDHYIRRPTNVNEPLEAMRRRAELAQSLVRIEPGALL